MVTPEEMLSMYLPDGTDLRRYEIVDSVKTDDPSLSPFVGRAEITIRERNVVPAEIAKGGRHLVSKGFFDPVKIYDFPIRNRLAKLVVVRRRWADAGSGEILSVPFAPKHPESFTSEELVDFLK